MSIKYSFSRREMQVVALLMEGKSNKQIAALLSISEGTVEFHLTSIYNKLGVSSRVEAVIQLGHLGETAGETHTEQGKTPDENRTSNDYDEREQVSSTRNKEAPQARIRMFSVLFGIAFVIIAGISLFLYLSMSGTWKGYERQCEYPDNSTVGQPIGRSNAYGDMVHGQFGSMNDEPWDALAGDVIYKNISTPASEELYLQLHYSKNTASSVPILVYLDDEQTPRASIFPENQQDWNRFTWTDKIFLGSIESGIHTIRLSTAGQQYGVADLDSFKLSAGSP